MLEMADRFTYTVEKLIFTNTWTHKICSENKDLFLKWL